LNATTISYHAVPRSYARYDGADEMRLEMDYYDRKGVLKAVDAGSCGWDRQASTQKPLIKWIPQSYHCDHAKHNAFSLLEEI
jgi:hypothetical protein